MTKTVTRLFPDHARARSAVEALERAGFSADAVSIVSPHRDTEPQSDVTPVETGATLGGVAGVGTGILAALGVIAVPGFGPLLASGVLATVLATTTGGVLAGSMIGSLIEYGMSEEEAAHFAEALKRGSTLVSIRAPEERAVEAQALLDRFAQPANGNSPSAIPRESSDGR